MPSAASTACSIRRGAGLAAGLVTAGLAHPAAAHQLGDVTSWTAMMSSFNAAVAERIAAITAATGPYYQLTMVLMGAFAALHLAVAVTRYVTGSHQIADLAETIVYLALVMALFVTYGLIVDVVTRAPYGIATIIQQAALGSDDLFAPMSYLYKVLDNIAFETDTSFWNLLGLVEDGIQWMTIMLVFLAVQLVYVVAIAYATVFPIIYLFALKIVGYLAIPFLLAGPLRFIFEGWLRQICATVLFVILAQGVMVANVLLIAHAFEIPWGATVEETVIRGTFSFLLLLAALVLGPIAIFQAQRVAAQWASAASLGTGAAQIARAVFTRGVVK
ncbi:type IV secretion system protein (plasmid) [Tistrella mobilis]|uniref:type IV secretion system protein n=1 Tax=Tistrella mobilis TaxID=171437 RepID=UPI003556333C